MHLHWERSNNSAGDCAIQALSWMGKVPEEIPEEDGWKLSRNNYYQEGWLSTANVRGVVGVTYTTSFCGGGQGIDVPSRTNYNLRGHRSEVTMVKWNEPYQKLASCDSTGIIFVWIKYEGRWSIELINDRNTPVTSFSWSHDGRMALICYQDGFVLVGSVAGQRYWSTMLPSDSTISCGSWTPDDQQVYVATAQGGIIVMDVHGNIVNKVSLMADIPITDLVWNCEKFNMEERDDTTNPFVDNKFNSRLCVLASCFKNGDIKLLRSYDDVSPVLLRTGFQTMFAEWSNSGELLAVAGRVSLTHTEAEVNYHHLNRIKFYTDSGTPVSTVLIPFYKSPVTALTWGHNDKRIFVATGPQVHIGWVSRKIASLQLLCRLKIHKTLRNAGQVEFLPLPCRLKNLLSSLFTQSIKCNIPERKDLKRFVSRPPATGLRLYCTMIRHGDEATGSNYTIYLEHLGGFLPILKGRKTSKLKPEFVIFDPLKDIECQFPKTPHGADSGGSLDASDTDLTDQEDTSLYSPRLRRRRRRRRRNQPHYFGYLGNEEVDYLNNLPEEGRMVEITSNIWGTKFKIHGLDISLPPLLGQISYKASLLHLQPRQMRLIVTELKDDMLLSSYQTYANSCSEDEDDTDKLTMEDEVLTAVTQKDLPVVAPLPISNRLSVADFQKTNIQDPRVGSFENADNMPWLCNSVPQVEVTVAKSPDRPPLQTTVCHSQSPKNAVAPSCSDGVIVEVQSEFSNLNGIHKRKLNMALSTTNPTPGVRNDVLAMAGMDFDQSSGKWCIKKNLSGSKSFDNQLDSSVIEVGSVANCLRRSKVRRDSVGASNSSGSSPNSSLTSPRRWAAKAEEIHELDNEASIFPANNQSGTVNRCLRSCSADHLGAIVDILGVPSSAPQFWENPRRLILSAEKKKLEIKRNLANCGKSRSLDTEDPPSEIDPKTLIKDCEGNLANESCNTCKNSDTTKDLEMNKEMFHISSPMEDDDESRPLIADNITPRTRRKFDSVRNLLEKARSKLSRSHNSSTSSEEHLKSQSNDKLGSEPGSPVHHPRSKWREKLSVPEQQISQSSPNTPLMARRLKSRRHQSFSPVRTLLNSPLLRRKKSCLDSSEEDISDVLVPDKLARPKPGYQNLETFQKQKLRQKLRKLNTLDTEFSDLKDRGDSHRHVLQYSSPDSSPRLSPRNGKELIMHNKAPLWNEGSQVYQLDFGGRVTQESAKNFQIEYSGKQVMQFGRIDANAYTLDFQYPLTAIQAFSVALANVTQRLK